MSTAKVVRTFVGDFGNRSLLKADELMTLVDVENSCTLNAILSPTFRENKYGVN